MAKRGRKMKVVEFREPNGRASRAREPVDKVALEARAKMLGLSVIDSKNQLAASFIGRLLMQYQAWEARASSDTPMPAQSLSQRQYDAATTYLKLRNDLLKVIDSAGAYYDREGSGDGDLEAYEEWGKRIKQRYDDAKEAIQKAQDETRTDNLWAALDLCVIRDQPLGYMVPAVRTLCNALARHWQMS